MVGEFQMAQIRPNSGPYFYKKLPFYTQYVKKVRVLLNETSEKM